MPEQILQTGSAPKQLIEKISVQSQAAPQVFSSSSALMGICFIVITSIKLVGKTDVTLVDNIAGFAIVFFMTSCVFSFLSFYVSNKKKKWLTKAANSVFMLGLSLLFITTMLFAFNVIK